MRVVDTSAWIEWLAGSATGRALASEIPPRQEQIVPTIVQYELALWAFRELDARKAERVIADTTKCNVVSLDTEIALRAAAVRRQHKLPTADSIVYATAPTYGADFLTCDAHFRGLPRALYIHKVVA